MKTGITVSHLLIIDNLDQFIQKNIILHIHYNIPMFFAALDVTSHML